MELHHRQGFCGNGRCVSDSASENESRGPATDLSNPPKVYIFAMSVAIWLAGRKLAGFGFVNGIIRTNGFDVININSPNAIYTSSVMNRVAHLTSSFDFPPLGGNVVVEGTTTRMMILVAPQTKGQCQNFGIRWMIVFRQICNLGN